MANYKDIHGVNIETVSSNPDNPANGQVWYNSTDQKLRANAQTTVGAWASGGSLNSARYAGIGGAGTTTAALAFGGYSASLPAPTRTGLTEAYNGTSWTEVNDLNTGRSGIGSAGQAPQTAALAFGGYADPGGVVGVVESWNGTNWTETTDLNTSRSRTIGAGITTAALAFGGSPNDGTALTGATESWNGSNWTEVNDLNTARSRLAGAGTYTAAIAAGGGPSNTAATEIWNGSSWTEVNDMNTARSALSPSAAGTNTDTIVFGGITGSVTGATEIWNGTNWTETTDLSTARNWGGGNGTSTSALMVGGATPPTSGAVEEFTGAGANTTKEFDLS